jgi:hypothetical protein
MTDPWSPGPRRHQRQRRPFTEAALWLYRRDRERRRARVLRGRPTRRRRRTGRLNPVPAVMAVVCVVVIATTVAGTPLPALERLVPEMTEVPRRAPRDRPDVPTPPAVIEPPDVPGGYVLSRTDRGDLFLPNPCEPIRYEIGRRHLPPGGAELIREVLAEITTISGQQFQELGFTDRIPDARDGSEAPEHYWIGWHTRAESAMWDDVSTSSVGVGGGGVGTRTFTGRSFRLQSAAALDADHGPLTEVNELSRKVLRHEVGHMIGLQHVADPNSIMNEAGTMVRDWSAGDRRGLWLAGPHGNPADCSRLDLLNVLRLPFNERVEVPPSAVFEGFFSLAPAVARRDGTLSSTMNALHDGGSAECARLTAMPSSASCRAGTCPPWTFWSLVP